MPWDKWRYVKIGSEGIAIKPDTGDLKTDMQTIAMCGLNESHARLITAAPEMADALEAIAIALQEPAGGEYWTARKFLDTQGVWHGDLGDERVLNAVAIAALKLAGRKP